jgi:methionine aminopeptidase
MRHEFYGIISCLAVDVTVYHWGFHGDLNETFLLGNVSPEAKKLVQVTSECLMKAINIGKYVTVWIL